MGSGEQGRLTDDWSEHKDVSLSFAYNRLVRSMDAARERKRGRRDVHSVSSLRQRIRQVRLTAIERMMSR